ncbi:DUF4157 domain-containing protein [Roseofilum sp. Guam]|uniref:eCIS core domain-containing protein n=1 Tax=Roseofilum sp. Guam TaxID=2821502 RepID=UPI001B09E590|nr:DUF4157 domain-containing protein [Roseofilum sp. Guam]MBP0028719.1 DUF4157 domain-containing protein [Roseofilum sp. Guam]
MARGQRRISKRSIVPSQGKGKTGHTVQAQSNPIQREGNQYAMGKDCPLVRHGNILQRIMERDARQPVVQRDNEGEEQQSVNLYPTGKGSPLPDEIVDNFSQQGHPEVANAEVHVDDVATQSIGAQAYTTQKKNIVVQSSVANDPKVLTHEATHVVQQHNMDVQPTIPNTPINDTLEQDAQDNEKRISQNQPVSVQLKGQNTQSSGSPMIQRKIEANNLGQLVEQQIGLQANVKANGIQDGKTYTTVGFEHEFAQMKDGPLRGLDHVEIGESSEHMPFTGINFKLETDANNALELVSPPFLVETIGQGSSIPVPEDLAKINRLISMDLQGAVNPEDRTIGEFVSTMKGSSNLTFKLKRRPDLGSEQRTPDNTRRSNVFKRFFHSWSSLKFGNPFKGNKPITRVHKIPGIHLKPSHKNGGILPQANVALSGKDLAKVIDKSSAPNVAISEKISAFGTLQMGIKAKLVEKGNELTNNQVSSELKTFLNQLARTLSGIVSVPFQSRELAAQGKATKMFGHWKQYWKGYNNDKKSDKNPEGIREKTWSEEENKYKIKYTWLKKYKEMELLTSHVKDVQDLWVKDTLMNFGLGLSLKPEDWDTVKTILLDKDIQGMLSGIEQNEAMSALRTQYPWAFSKNRGIGPKMVAGANKIISQIQSNKLDTTAPNEDLDFGVDEQRSFLSHKDKYISPRQDTFLKGGTVKLPGSGNRAHVLESRRNVNSFLETLKDIRSEQVPVNSEPDRVNNVNSETDRVNNQLQPPEQGFRGRRYKQRQTPQVIRDYQLKQLQKNHPVNSLVRYRIANNVNRVSHRGGPVDIDCLAKVTGHDYNNQSNQPVLQVTGIAFVNSKTLNALGHGYDAQEWVSKFEFDLNAITPDHIGASRWITKEQIVI